MRAQIEFHTYIKARELSPKFQMLDNEGSTLLKQYFIKEGIKYQLVLSNLHSNNVVKNSIETFTDHLITGICSCDPEFPTHLWCILLEHITTTLNSMQQSNINP